jgi:hypothetical protein
MAVAQEFIDFFVPIGIIRRKYPGGWKQCLCDHQNLIGGRVWHDEHLFRDGAMSPADMHQIVAHWKKLGFETLREMDGHPVEWVDVCVSESMFGGPTFPCTWLAFDEVTGGAYLKGTEPGKLVGRRG